MRGKTAVNLTSPYTERWGVGRLFSPPLLYRTSQDHKALRGRIAEYPSIPRTAKGLPAGTARSPHWADDLPALESDLSSVKPRPFINGH